MKKITLTLQSDVAAKLRKVQDERELSLERAINEALRAGLSAVDEQVAGARIPYVTKPWDAGKSRLANVDDIGAALAKAEGNSFR